MAPRRRLVVLAGIIVAAAGFTVVGPAPTASADLIGFSSVSGNIGCIMDSSHVRCDIRERDWAPPPPPPDCPFDYGQGIILHPGAPAEFVCAGDTTLVGGPPLDLHEPVRVGSLTCTNYRTHLRCDDVDSGHGFSLAREGYSLD